MVSTPRSSAESKPIGPGRSWPNRCMHSMPTAPVSRLISTLRSPRCAASSPPTARWRGGWMPRWKIFGTCSKASEDHLPQVTVTISGRQFRMACEEGQEAHLQQLARELDDRIGALRGQFGEIGDARLTVMAALMLADELSEMVKKLKRLDQDHVALQDARGAAVERD